MGRYRPRKAEARRAVETVRMAPYPDFEVKVRKLIEDIIIISRQELHQAKDFTTLR